MGARQPMGRCTGRAIPDIPIAGVAPPAHQPAVNATHVDGRRPARVWNGRATVRCDREPLGGHDRVVTGLAPPGSHRGTPRARALAPLYVVVFVGFLGYSLMITVFTPMILANDNGMLPASSSAAARSIVLGFLLCLYPLGQFVGAPVLGAISDRVRRRPVLLGSLGRLDRLVRGDRGGAARQEPPPVVGCFVPGRPGRGQHLHRPEFHRGLDHNR